MKLLSNHKDENCVKKDEPEIVGKQVKTTGSISQNESFSSWLFIMDHLSK